MAQYATSKAAAKVLATYGWQQRPDGAWQHPSYPGELLNVYGRMGWFHSLSTGHVRGSGSNAADLKTYLEAM
jgi:hypothetical protein